MSGRVDLTRSNSIDSQLDRKKGRVSGQWDGLRWRFTLNV